MEVITDGTYATDQSVAYVPSMVMPDCQPSAAPTGSTPGCRNDFLAQADLVSATVLVQSHHAQSPVVAAPRTVEASLHLAFGLGSGWMLTDAMFIETAHMGQTQPEGLALATYLTGSGMIANVMVVPLFYYLQRRLSWRIERWVWVGLLFQISSAVLAALSWRVRLRAPLGSAAARPILPPGAGPVDALGSRAQDVADSQASHLTTPGWRVSLGPTSPCLYAVAFLSTIGGNFQQLAVVPWVQEGAARPACVSWTMAGANLGAVRAQPQCALALTLGLTLALASAL